MKNLIMGMLVLSTTSAFAGEQIQTKCSYIPFSDAKLIEKAIEKLVEVNSKSNFNILVSHSVSFKDDRALICVTSKN